MGNNLSLNVKNQYGNLGSSINYMFLKTHLNLIILIHKTWIKSFACFTSFSQSAYGSNYDSTCGSNFDCSNDNSFSKR